MSRLAGKVAIVTGGGGGIGRQACIRFAQEGAAVVVADWNQESGEETVAAIRAAGGTASFVRTDLTSESAVSTLIQESLDRYGGLHVLFNVAGMSGRRFGDGPAHLCTEEGWDRTLEINAKSAFLTCKYALPHMIEGGGGSIINLASVLGMVGGGRFFATHAYAASKAAVIGLSRAMAVHYAQDKVRVNVIAPGLIETPMSQRAQQNPDIVAYMQQMQPITGSMGMPEDVAEAAVYLASDESRFITGIVLPVDGGWTAQ